MTIGKSAWSLTRQPIRLPLQLIRNKWTTILENVQATVFPFLTMVGLAADLRGLPLETVTKSSYPVIESSLTFYTVYIVERMHKQGGSPQRRIFIGRRRPCHSGLSSPRKERLARRLGR